MLVVDYLQPSPDGHHLAIVWFPFRVDDRSRCDVALVRLSPDVVAQIPDAGSKLASQPGQCWGKIAQAFIESVQSRDTSSWARAGVTLMDHHADVSPDAASGVVAQLLKHAAWSAAKEASELSEALHTAIVGRARARL